MEEDRYVKINDSQCGYGGSNFFLGNSESIEPNTLIFDLQNNIFSDMCINVCWNDALT